MSGLPGYISGILAYLGYAHVLSGRLAHGLSFFEQFFEHWTEEFGSLGGSSGYAWTLASVAEVYSLANRQEEANRTIKQALDFAREHKRRAHEAWALRALGEIASHRDPPDAETAEAAYRQGMALAEELGMRPVLAHCHLGLGALFGRVGKHREAGEHLATAAMMYREMEMRFWLDQVDPIASGR